MSSYLISLQQSCRALHQGGQLQCPHHQIHPGPELQAGKNTQWVCQDMSVQQFMTFTFTSFIFQSHLHVFWPFCQSRLIHCFHYHKSLLFRALLVHFLILYETWTSWLTDSLTNGGGTFVGRLLWGSTLRDVSVCLEGKKVCTHTQHTSIHAGVRDPEQLLVLA